jgi:hypothetical protein
MILTANNNFLEQNFGDRKYDTIIMNPPWVKVGRLFIEKARNLLKPNGKLICIIGYNQFANTTGNPGTFNYLQNTGHFERIEVFKGTSQRDYFCKPVGKGVGDWCWFIWTKLGAGKTTIVNRLGEIFEYELKGNEYYVPQIPNETDYFDWDNGVRSKDATANRISKSSGTYIVLRKLHKSLIIKYVPSGSFLKKKGVIYRNIDISKTLEKLYKKIDLYTLYADSKSGDRLRCPPIKKELIREYHEKS